MNLNGDNLEKIMRELIIGDDTLTRIAEANYMYAKQNCPVKEGELQDSIHYVIDQDNLAVIVGSDCPHAKFVEYGVKQWERVQGGPHNPRKPKTDWKAKRETGRNPLAQMPFLRPAAFRTQNELGELFIPKKVLMNVQVVVR